jgi:TonB dependent receptor/Carboxypeptidase regulatory-like domain/TonB-dependent Receptor Plug Domain
MTLALTIVMASHRCAKTRLRSRQLAVAVAVLTAMLVATDVLLARQLPTGRIDGRVTDETGGALPGVVVQVKMADGSVSETVTNATGDYSFDALAEGSYELSFSLINFATLTRRDVRIGKGATQADAVLSLSLSADVTVVGKRIFANLADVDNPAENLIGIAQSASQGAITARQLDVRPLLRQGEVLEAVPGMIITQHSGEGKANQYFLRGFNLDHGSDFAMTVAGTPVNMPTHAHSQGYSDINFLIPELVAGVQFSKGPYFAEQGDFATAGASNINYATSLDRSFAHIEFGTYQYSRVVVATSPRFGKGHLMAAFDGSTNAGPWTVPDDVRKFNGVLRYSQGDSVNGFSITGMGYHGTWNATEASPERAVDSGMIDRFGTIDPTDRGQSSRYSLSGDWQRGSSGSLTKLSAYGLWYDLNLISNFTFYLDDPVHGDQAEQVDHRFVSGFKVSHRRLDRWRGHTMQNTVGVQVRNDSIPEIGLYHTENTVRIETRSKAAALVTSAGVYGQNETEWLPWLRTLAGARIDGSHYRVDAIDPANSGTANAGLVSPKGSATFGPWKKTELYVNAGSGFHSNNALGVTITRDLDGHPVDPVTPLVRANGAEIGVRTVALPHLQTTASLWTLRLASELVYNADAGATEPGPGSKRFGVEISNYFSPTRWLVFDGDISLSQARFADGELEGQYVPEAVGTVVSAGASIDGFRRMYGSLRLRYFGPRALTADNSVRSEPTTLVNLGAGYGLSHNMKVTVDLFNLFDANVSDIEYFFTSRLRGEPVAGVDDVHFHPAVPRTLRVGLIVGF